MFCTHCGQELNSNNECPNEFCPSKINNISQSINGFSNDEIMAFLNNKNASYYSNEFIIHNKNSKFVSWNFSAFLFHWIWMFYRKMNLMASIYLLTYFIGLIFLPTSFFIGLSFIGHILCGLFGNSIYMNYCLKKISSIKPIAEKINPNSYTRMLQYHGGTSILFAIIMSFVYFFLLSILLLFSINYSISYLDYPDNPSNYYEDDNDLPYWYNTPRDYSTTDKDAGTYI